MARGSASDRSMTSIWNDYESRRNLEQIKCVTKLFGLSG